MYLCKDLKHVWWSEPQPPQRGLSGVIKGSVRGNKGGGKVTYLLVCDDGSVYTTGIQLCT